MTSPHRLCETSGLPEISCEHCEQIPYLTDLDARELRVRIAGLPQLAADSVIRDTSNGVRVARQKPGSTPPPGVDLDRIDLSRGREQPALLARLSGCVRAVAEQLHQHHRPVPDMALGTDISWSTESRWLIQTMTWWQTDDWCAEWCATEVDTIERKLTKAKTRAVDVTRQTCASCGTRITAHTTDQLMVAQCPDCGRIAGMKPRLTQAQRATAAAAGASRLLRKLGILPG